jgi:hypothetical protein
MGSHDVQALAFETGNDLLFHCFLRWPTDLIGRKAQVTTRDEVGGRRGQRMIHVFAPDQIRYASFGKSFYQFNN